MLVNDKGAIERLNSPLNLINQLKSPANSRKSAMSLFIPPKSEPTEPKTSVIPPLKPQSFNPFNLNKEVDNGVNTSKVDLARNGKPGAVEKQAGEPVGSTAPELDDILEDPESIVKLGLTHNNALDLLAKSVDMMKTKLDDIKPDKLPAVIGAASKVVESIRKERNEAAKNNKDREVHFHFYTPQQKKVTEYEVIDVQ